MAEIVHRAAWISRGWMSFTITGGNVLELGGVTQTTPTDSLSASSFLSTGIPQVGDKSKFAESRTVIADLNGHAIKHAIVEIVSVANAVAAGTSEGRRMTNGSTPTTSKGVRQLANDLFIIENNRDAIFNYKLFNRSAGNMVVEVEVFE